MRNYDKSYNAVAGQQYSESLPIGYASAVFVNQSGHYILVRAGALTAPGNIQSAEHLIPPNSVSAINLRSMFIAFSFTDLVTGLSDNLSTGLDGVCKVSYTLGAVVEYTQLLPGGTTAAALPVGFGSYSYVTGVVDATDTPFLIVSGGSPTDPPPPKVYLRRCYSAFTEDLGGSGGTYYLLIRPLSGGSGNPILAAGKVDVGYVPPIEFTAPPGADFRIPYGSGLYLVTGAVGTGIFFLAEYRTTP